ncbi:MAG: Gfo/Idh/MocA family oxidoreductase [Mariprofundales bacterium]
MYKIIENNKKIRIAIVGCGRISKNHFSQTVKIASYGKHVLTEKPMATRWSGLTYG